MNKSERFFRRYIFSIVSIIILFLFVNILLVASFFAAAYLGNVKNSNFPIEDFSNHITETNGQFNADIQAEDMLNLSLIHISEPTRRTPISYAVFCLKKKMNIKN